MRALILSGGEGSRLRPITYTSAKQLIPVGGQPILFRAIESIRDAGIDDVGIVVGATADEVRAAVGDGSRWGVRVTYIRQEAPLGLAHAVLTAREFVRGQPFLMYLGDNVLLEGLSRFVEEFERARPDAQIFLARVPEPERFGVAVLDGERVTGFAEKPRAEHWINGGFFCFEPAVFDYLTDSSVLEREPLEGLAEDGELNPLQEAFTAHHALQCGFCTPGFLMLATALLRENPSPTDEEIREAMASNLCRCTGYSSILAAVRAAARGS
jgi:glucose-1-phosphate thymidylyltransferase long form